MLVGRRQPTGGHTWWRSRWKAIPSWGTPSPTLRDKDRGRAWKLMSHLLLNGNSDVLCIPTPPTSKGIGGSYHPSTENEISP